MSFQKEQLEAALAQAPSVVRIVIAGFSGSSPRETGASMLVWEDGQSGTIGGGALEWDAIAKARRTGCDGLQTIPLGPNLGQCCGGVVTLLFETYDSKRLAGITGEHVLRRVQGHADIPLDIQRQLNLARSSGSPVQPVLSAGWMLESVSAPRRNIWIYGAGHVGRALVNVLADLPDVAITWVDTAADRYPDHAPDNVRKLIAANPADVVKYAPAGAEHLVLTYSHALDLELCHQLLAHGFSSAGLIGSHSKWARFRSRLRGLGHTDAQISRITCPIGQPELGKHPQAIAVGVAASLLAKSTAKKSAKDKVG